MAGLRDGLAAHVHLVFMISAASIFVYGGALASALDPVLDALHAITVATALFVAHLRDGYIDGRRRGEGDPALTMLTFRTGIGLGTGLVLLLAGILWF